MRHFYRHVGMMVILWGAAFGCFSQGIYISHFRPGDYLSDNRHRVDIYNPLPQTVYLGGWMLATRDYIMRFPAGTRIPRESALQIGKAASGSFQPDVVLNREKDFLIKIRDRNYEGNYIALLNPSREIVDAFYFSPLPKVPFLPREDTLITFDQKKVPYRLPSEVSGKWSYVSMAEDPAIAFVRINRQWTVTSASAGAEVPAAYGNLSLRYDEGVITLKWSTRFEHQCGPHVIEMSEDQRNFEEVDRVDSRGESPVLQQYTHFIAEPEKNKTLYFRIRTENIFGNEAISRIAGITTEEGIEEFSLEAFVGKRSGRKELNVRFESRFSQRVKIRLLDRDLRDMGLLFRDYVYADTPNLLKFEQEIEPGSYWILVETEARRFWEEVFVPAQ